MSALTYQQIYTIAVLSCDKRVSLLIKLLQKVVNYGEIDVIRFVPFPVISFASCQKAWTVKTFTVVINSVSSSDRAICHCQSLPP
jgi:hypothetical protein